VRAVATALLQPKRKGQRVPRTSYLFTSESVSEGHPDKVCDRISDAIVDAYLTADPYSRVAVETMATTNRVFLAGETRGPASVTNDLIEQVVRRAIKEIGYEQDGFHWQKVKIETFIHPQSADIAQGVDASGNKDEGAGDQGIMFGYACARPSIHAGSDLLRAQHPALAFGSRHSGAEPGLGPDCQEPSHLAYENGKPVRATSVVVSTQHTPDLDQEAVREIVRPHVVNTLPSGWMCPEEEFYVNPTGRFVIGGPDGDAGLTGRKIIVDYLWRRGARTAAARFQARIRPRSTARRPMLPAILPRTLSLPVWPSAARSSCPTPSAWPSRCRSMSRPMAPAPWPRTEWSRFSATWSISVRAVSANILV
jgi:S-adenosylmethionine synthetase